MNNWNKEKDKLVKHLSESTICATCYIRDFCTSYCTENRIDRAKNKVPCTEIWNKWSDIDMDKKTVKRSKNAK